MCVHMYIYALLPVQQLRYWYLIIYKPNAILTEVGIHYRICGTIGPFKIVYLALSNHVFHKNWYQIQADCIEQCKSIKYMYKHDGFVVCFESGVSLNNCSNKMTWLQK